MVSNALDPILGDLLEITLDEDRLNFEAARQTARERVRKMAPDAMLLSWHDRCTGAFGPPVRCGADTRAPWVVWAASRGADLTVRVNQGVFVFYFLLRPRA
jgi:hypothetical protein